MLCCGLRIGECNTRFPPFTNGCVLVSKAVLSESPHIVIRARPDCCCDQQAAHHWACTYGAIEGVLTHRRRMLLPAASDQGSVIRPHRCVDGNGHPLPWVLEAPPRCPRHGQRETTDRAGREWMDVVQAGEQCPALSERLDRAEPLTPLAQRQDGSFQLLPFHISHREGLQWVADHRPTDDGHAKGEQCASGDRSHDREAYSRTPPPGKPHAEGAAVLRRRSASWHAPGGEAAGGT
ncbi:MAG: hypothetical protein QOE72_2452 [Chloroflexota bacterium]|nr:hypothetical protein [Chloroflexota bacterium]